MCVKFLGQIIGFVLWFYSAITKMLSHFHPKMIFHHLMLLWLIRAVSVMTGQMTSLQEKWGSFGKTSLAEFVVDNKYFELLSLHVHLFQHSEIALCVCIFIEYVFHKLTLSVYTCTSADCWQQDPVIEAARRIQDQLQVNRLSSGQEHLMGIGNTDVTCH